MSWIDHISGRGAAMLLAAALFLPGAAQAQQGFRTDPNKPIEIEADALEVQDTKQTATFSGNVRVNQGDIRMKSDKVIVHYDGSGQGSSRISRISATGNVFVSSPDQQTASGDWATYTVQSRQIEMGNSVILRQGENVIRGSRLTVDLATGQARVTGGPAGESGGTTRVRGLFQPGNN
ncbi:lipopolysaccharide transport periplasmic protein LptA [Parvibaculum sp.]|jgi:lipopolysaccharide export system protein LptA|uniref:lipopolysaccharide transport periplasmic protein LptA n=1 Tax=Parvibaculum sp. TaxID=2024848 RepID=UPI00346C7E5E